MQTIYCSTKDDNFFYFRLNRNNNVIEICFISGFVCFLNTFSVFIYFFVCCFFVLKQLVIVLFSGYPQIIIVFD